VIVGGMAKSIDTIDGLVEKYFPTIVMSPPKPFIETDKKEYTRKNGMATVMVTYSNVFSSKDNNIALYRITDDNKALFYEDRQIETLLKNEGKGKVKFDLPFNGKYEVRMLYDDEIKIGKVYFTVTGEDDYSNSKFKDLKCLFVRFAGTIYIKTYSQNRVGGPMFGNFEIDVASCTHHKKAPRSRLLKPLEINWNGGTFYATTTWKRGFNDTVVYFIKGKLSDDGKILKSVKIKSVTTAEPRTFSGTSFRKKIQEATLVNIPLSKTEKMFVVYGTLESLKEVNYLETTTYPGKPENKYTAKYVKKDGYHMDGKDSFVFKLRLFK
jgi:hypothetical protein